MLKRISKKYILKTESIIYKLIRNKRLNNNDVNIIDKIIENKDYKISQKLVKNLFKNKKKII